LKLSIEGEDYELPKILLDLEDLHSLISFDKYKEIFTAEEQKHLQTYLPKSQDPEVILKSLFAGETFYISNPLDFFLERLHSGQFSHVKQQEIRLQKQLYNHSILEHFENIYEGLKESLENNNLRQSYLYKRKSTKLLEDLFTSESDQDKRSISGISLENSFSELSQGYSTPISLTEEPQIPTFAHKKYDLNFALQENRLIEARKTLFDVQKNKKTTHPDSDSLQSLIVSKTMNPTSPNNNLLLPKPASNNPSTKKSSKNINSKEWIENFRAQENERYNNPTRPFTYMSSDGSKGIVAPVSKKICFTSATKPRDHFLLKTERPPYITILCLVRDAASRLPNGFGTRADICELLKESQFINEHVPDDKLSNIVSGALDRLHYEDDACVKYDPEKKLWIYLHKGRTENYPAWMEQNDSRSSKKKEYNQKYKNKKRVRIEDIKTIHK